MFVRLLSHVCLPTVACCRELVCPGLVLNNQNRWTRDQKSLRRLVQACRLVVFVVRCWAGGGVKSCGSGKKVRCSGEMRKSLITSGGLTGTQNPWITWSLAAELHGDVVPLLTLGKRQLSQRNCVKPVLAGGEGRLSGTRYSSRDPAGCSYETNATDDLPPSNRRTQTRRDVISRPSGLS